MAFRHLVGALKTFVAVILFLLGCLSVVYTQTVGIVLFATKNDILKAWISTTKKSFIVLLITILNFVSRKPTQITLISKNIGKDRLCVNNGEVKFVISQNTVIFANHQIYTDWVYLWWITYIAELSGFVYIILKDSLKKIPILGYGMNNFKFIFLSRRWEKDQITMSQYLESMDADGRGKGPASGNIKEIDGSWPKGVNQEARWPYSLIIFPEGTNLSANTRDKTETYAEKVGKKPFKHVLLPKTTGLRFSLLKLRGSVEEILDVTIGYSGVKQTEYGQDIYKLSKVFLEGKSPEHVEFFIKSHRIDEIPLGKIDETEEEAEISKQEFEDWLFQVWQEKDELLDHYYSKGSFIKESDKNDESLSTAETKLSVSLLDFIKVFSIPFITLVLVRLFYFSLFKRFF